MEAITGYSETKLLQAAPSTNLLAAIVDSSEDTIISMTLDGRVTSWNAAAERLFGYSAAEVIGNNISLIIPAELGEDQRNIALQVQQGELIKHYKTIRVGRDDQSIDINLTVSPVRGADEEIIGASMIMQDITAQQIIERQLQAYLKELENSNHDLHTFAHIASHDLKEPLRGVSGLSSILREDYRDKLDADGAHLLDRITSLCQSMDSLINNLLYFSELENEKSATQITDPNEIVKEIRQMMEFTLKERSAHIVLPRPLPSIVCNKVRITEVFRNLITNALKHNDKKEPVVEVGFLEKIETRNGPEKDVFYIKDNGIGIEPKYQRMIFTMFKSIISPPAGEKQPDAGRESGTGVGLTFSKKIIERHGGRIWLESEPGNGSTFYFTLHQKDIAHG